MSRLSATLLCDMRLQWRNGFYWAVAFLLTTLLILVSQLPVLNWRPILPPLVLGNLVTATFFFMAGLVLLEKEEGTIEAQIVTPLRPREYLISKAATLTALSIVEHLVIALALVGTDFSLLPFVIGVITAALLYSFAAFPAIVRYQSINELLLPTTVWVTAFSLPILSYAGLFSSPIMYLHPFQAPLVLLTGAIEPLTPAQWIYGIAYSSLWIAIAYRWSLRAFHQFVIATPGVQR